MNARQLRGGLAFALVALTAGVLTGCAGAAAPSASQTPTAPPTTSAPAPSPTPTPTPTPSATAEADPADPSTWVITETGVGPVVLGGDFEATAYALTALGWTRGCGDGPAGPDAKVLFSHTPGADLIVAAQYDESTGDHGTGVGTISIGGDAESTPRTADDIGIGTALADVPAALPGATDATYGQGFTGYAVPWGAGTLYLGGQQVPEVTGIDLTLQSRAPMEFCG
ncbi:hypothetical protein [Microbacterium gorillae]|uniref:hypothetical protein n=1 Tax=Microbacterium gorillae TaxID=1231063 RepID=UPI0006939D92|nr:hypothetical protein [Microbacterium gorillae]